ncbi:hypothetical protein POSPLADRAFT_1152537 [Postia placenta MAD-698-R-SB12]|uniref:Uncharacterized protein n=1 Tax=Postia placenta MAD-698-R-SB12 TaxID=670580 RepID=A0A1X6MR66_9APHY|nr:hypothetical protein POSPLADRAFT_1152537 [Postia placenta MAD-698-R-SB12]OSX58672.1 hypothetical protein POSPLADRAFT_1152537 [Postia placenta MAD-698-R-SB12]
MGSLTTPDAVYASQLFRCGEGLPLWSPEHTKHGEVLVGDVGYMRHGAFYRLFNATKAADDPINKEYGVPNGNSYKPFTQSQYGLNRDLNAISPGPMCSKSLTKLIVGGGAGTHGVDASFHFKCTDDQGAFLLLKDAATREELHPSRRMENYMHRNFRSWQSFAVDDLDVDLQPEDIMFVRGWVKTTQWAVAAITHEGREARVSISGEIGSVADAHLSIHKSDEVSNYYAHRTGPSRILHRKRHKHHHSSDSGSVEPSERDDADQLDQCIFLHYYKLKRRRFLGFKKLEAAAEPRDPSGPHDDDDEFVVEEASAREKASMPMRFRRDSQA